MISTKNYVALCVYPLTPSDLLLWPVQSWWFASQWFYWMTYELFSQISLTTSTIVSLFLMEFDTLVHQTILCSSLYLPDFTIWINGIPCQQSLNNWFMFIWSLYLALISHVAINPLFDDIQKQGMLLLLRFPMYYPTLYIGRIFTRWPPSHTTIVYCIYQRHFTLLPY
jgi:hypothetical protein